MVCGKNVHAHFLLIMGSVLTAGLLVCCCVCRYGDPQ
jgi:hypothetical protein